MAKIIKINSHDGVVGLLRVAWFVATTSIAEGTSPSTNQADFEHRLEKYVKRANLFGEAVSKLLKDFEIPE